MFPVEESGVDETEEGGIHICALLGLVKDAPDMGSSQALFKIGAIIEARQIPCLEGPGDF